MHPITCSLVSFYSLATSRLLWVSSVQLSEEEIRKTLSHASKSVRSLPVYWPPLTPCPQFTHHKLLFLFLAEPSGKRELSSLGTWWNPLLRGWEFPISSPRSLRIFNCFREQCLRFCFPKARGKGTVLDRSLGLRHTCEEQ